MVLIQVKNIKSGEVAGATGRPEKKPLKRFKREWVGVLKILGFYLRRKFKP